MEEANSKILLCFNPAYSIADYNKDFRQGNKKRIARFIFDRFKERYIKPFKNNRNKNGFSMMAVACLMIEALESFYQGYEDTKSKSKDCFKTFFEHCDELKEFRGLENDFYYHIRCGILHQAETRDGWKISRKKEFSLLNKTTRIINATKFLNQLEKYLIGYREELEKSNLTDEIWKKFEIKMIAIIKNCQEKS
ncbi:MAG: hypothetical protein ACXABO_01655 [Promethearchaeota archaeon]|jgi:hypothetical protein